MPLLLCEHMAMLTQAPAVQVCMKTNFKRHPQPPAQVVLLARERQEALEDAAQCRAEATPLEAPDTYAQAAKMQRRALMREKHAQQLATLQARAVPLAFCQHLPLAISAALMHGGDSL